MEYEVATGASIPNLGEKKFEMWTEGASAAKTINMQVADVHKAPLSLSRCADMVFESRFGKQMGFLIDTELGEVIPLQRRGNLYVLRCWIRAAPLISNFRLTSRCEYADSLLTNAWSTRNRRAYYIQGRFSQRLSYPIS